MTLVKTPTVPTAATNGKINHQPATTPPADSSKTSLKSVLKETPDADKLPPIDDRLHKLNVLFDLQKKYAKLQETKAKLSAFEIAADRENSELTIIDDAGEEFRTTNPAIITEVTKLIHTTVIEKCKILDSQIRF